jgi:hypothetical protein
MIKLSSGFTGNADLRSAFYFPQALQLSGSRPQLGAPAGLAVSLAGSLPMFDCSILCSFVSDGSQYDATYIGGTVGIYDRGAEEQLVYLLQGSSRQYQVG